MPGCAEQFDSLEANFRCLFAIGGGPAELAEKNLPGLEKSVKDSPLSAGAHALLGRALSLLTRYEPAGESLRRALELDGAQAQTRVWLGELYLQRGEHAAARLEFDSAADSDPRYGWSYFFRAACAAAQGKPEAALADLERIRNAVSDWGIAARAFSALLWTSGGRAREALESLTTLVEQRPRQAWPYALRALARQALGDYDSAEKDLASALRLEAAAWIYRERSVVRERLGHIAGAIADMDAALELAGPQTELYMRRAHLRICNRHYHLAVPDYGRAIELNPRLVEAYVGRATVHMIRDHQALALADMRQAEKISGNDPAVSLERIRFEIRASPQSRLLEELDALAERESAWRAQAKFTAGCYWLKTKRYAQSAAAFEQAARLSAGTDYALKIAYYLSVARALGERTAPLFPPGRPRAPRLVIVGLGMRPPYTATADGLRAIESCDLVFNNLSEPEIGDLLNLLAPRALPTMFDVRGADARWTRSIFREIKPGRTVGFVTRGHPLVCGGLAGSLIRECGKQAVLYRVLGSVSSMDTLAVMDMPGELNGFWGRQALDYGTVFSPDFSIDTAVPTVIYFNSTVMTLSKRHYQKFCSILEKAYGAAHHCFFYGRNFNAPPDSIPLRSLRGHYGGLDPSFTLLIPPRSRPLKA